MPQRTRAQRGEPMRFLQQALLDQTGECIIWPYAKNGTGYGYVKVDGRQTRVAQVVLERTVGPAPHPGMVAAHAPLVCHTPSCCQWRHLRWATSAENAADRSIDGTQFHAKGELGGKAKLTEAQARSAQADPRSCRGRAAADGVSFSTIAHIKSRRRWPHLN